MRRVPVPLLAVLCVAALQALAWSVLLPAFQGQDEVEHFSYAQRIAETGKPTWSALEDLPPGKGVSRETRFALLYGGFRGQVGNVQARPYGTELDEDRWEAVERRLTDDEQAAQSTTAAFRNPPAYYLYEALAYAPFGSADLMTRQYVLRWASIPFVVIAVLMAWLLAGELFGRRRWLQAVAALFVALQPMLGQIGGIVNPDAMIAAIFATALWIAARIVNRGATRGLLVAAAATGIGALLVHPRAAPALLVLCAALCVRVGRAWRGNPRRLRLGVVGLAAGAAVLVAAQVWYAVRGDLSALRVREFASYVWQFYLPRPGFMTETRRPDWDVRDLVVDRLWSGYLTHDVTLAPGLLDVISIATMAGAVLVLVTMAWRRDAVARRLGHLVVLGVAVVATLLLLHATAWRELSVRDDPILTGRYLLPLLPIAGVALAAVAGSLPRRVGPGAATLVLGLEALLALGALGATVVRFHA